MYIFFFNDTATTEIYTLSLHDALPILHRDELLHLLAEVAPLHVRGLAVDDRGQRVDLVAVDQQIEAHEVRLAVPLGLVDRKSTRLNSSHANISYAVFCLKKNKSTELYR